VREVGWSFFKYESFSSLKYPTPHRFADDPWIITGKMRRTNPDFNQAAFNLLAGAAPVNADAFRNDYVRPLEGLPAVYLDEYVGGQFLFGKLDVTIDGVTIDNGDMGQQGFHYAVANRAFASEKLRREKYGRGMPGVAHSGERTVVAAVAATEGQPARVVINAVNVTGGDPVAVQAARPERAYVPAVPRTNHPLPVRGHGLAGARRPPGQRARGPQVRL
jgi:hypothetical protein